MEQTFEHKRFNCKALDVDQTNRKVKIAIAELESIDHSKEVLEPTIFDRSIAARGPKGSNEIWHMADHSSSQKGFSGYSLEKALSKFSELGREGKYINGVSEYRDTWMWREVAWPLYEAGDINQHSAGFLISPKQKERKSGYTILKEGILMEGSAVIWGDNPNTPTHAVIKSLLKEKTESASDRIDWICKAIKEGKYQGENESLLILELKELSSLYTIPDPSLQDTPIDDPEEKPLIKELKHEAILTFIEVQKQLFTN